MERKRRKGGTDSEGAADAGELWRIDSKRPSDGEGAYRALRERVKELNCLYGVAQLVERRADSLGDLLSDLVDFLPLSWQWPKRTSARIHCEG